MRKKPKKFIDSGTEISTTWLVMMAANADSSNPFVIATDIEEDSQAVGAYPSIQEFMRDITQIHSLAFQNEVEAGKYKRMKLTISFDFA